MKLILKDGLLKDPNQGMQADENKVYPFKGRTIDMELPIMVYRNLKRKGKWYSIKQNNLVVGHTTAICISDCEFIVTKSGKERAIKTMTRNVHAYIKGTYAISGMGTTAKVNDLPAHIKYNPFNNIRFYCENLTIKPYEVKGARFCIVNEEGVKAAYPH